MEISLREWLIIGGILVVALILFDGWRRIRGNRNRIRLDIDRSAVGEVQADETPPANPELPNGGARRCASRMGHERQEPTFDEADHSAESYSAESRSEESRSEESRSEKSHLAERRFAESHSEASYSEASDSDPIHPAEESALYSDPDEAPVADVPAAERAPEPEIEAAPEIRAEGRTPLHDMDPLFDDVPVERRPLRATREDRDEEAATASANRSEVRLENLSMEFDFDPEQPIPVLMDRVRSSNAGNAGVAQRSAKSGDGVAVTPKRESRRATKADPDPRPHPELPFGDEAAEVKPIPVAEKHQIPEQRMERSVEPTGRENRSEPAPEVFSAVEQEQQEQQQSRPAPEITPNPEDMLVIFVVAHRGEVLAGGAVRRIVDACGMEFGEMGIFHRHEQPNGKGSLQFSMADAIQPGTFDLNSIDESETPAVTFFMSMHDPADPLDAYECMLATAETLARHLGAELLDGDRSVMRPQTKEHYRERIRDFEIHKRVKRAH